VAKVSERTHQVIPQSTNVLVQAELLSEEERPVPTVMVVDHLLVYLLALETLVMGPVELLPGL
jgi:hypothetical protein